MILYTISNISKFCCGYVVWWHTFYHLSFTELYLKDYWSFESSNITLTNFLWCVIVGGIWLFFLPSWVQPKGSIIISISLSLALLLLSILLLLLLFFFLLPSSFPSALLHSSSPSSSPSSFSYPSSFHSNPLAAFTASIFPFSKP